MHVPYSFMEKIELSPEIRFMLLKFFNLYDSGNAIDWSFKKLADECGVTVKFIVKYLRVLQDEGYLKKINIDNKGRRGRPKGNYSFTGKFEKKLNVANKHYKALPSHVLNIINRILSIENGDPHSKLKARNRLLLCVLAANSYRSGIVNNLSVHEISALTGMSKDQIRSQTKKLIELGYISKYLSGISHSIILGKKKSVYFLNLKSKFSLKIEGEGEARLLTENSIFRFNHLKFPIKENLLTTKYINALWPSAIDLLREIEKIFMKHNISSLVIDHFQLMLEEALCQYITRYKSDSLAHIKSKMAYINEDLFPRKSHQSGLIENEKTLFFDVICHFIYTFGFNFRSYFGDPNREPENISYQIIYPSKQKILMRYTD